MQQWWSLHDPAGSWRSETFDRPSEIGASRAPHSRSDGVSAGVALKLRGERDIPRVQAMYRSVAVRGKRQVWIDLLAVAAGITAAFHRRTLGKGG